MVDFNYKGGSLKNVNFLIGGSHEKLLGFLRKAIEVRAKKIINPLYNCMLFWRMYTLYNFPLA